ncbi:MAG TPA: cbb3-type cytochrome c oxidase subunit II, partial [Gemmatimonadales bacterium]|nr:cbb3-type cytochrome c oxidase subunit II [Gemmatimonadales bacterium]
AAPAAPEPATAPVAPPEGTPTPATGPAPVVVTAGPVEPPVLVGRTESPLRALAAATGLVALLVLIGFIAPALPSEGNGVYTSAVPLSAAGIEGRDIYLREGCASCHTQQVRPIVADAGLGGVTVSDSNQILGSRRYGPDLAHIGSRIEDDADLVGVLQGADHPSYAGLGDSDLTALTAYLSESK